MKKIGIVMGSDSDLAVAQKAADTLKELGVPFEVHVYSAHRTPEAAAKFSKEAREKGFGAIIAFAGKAAHLAGALREREREAGLDRHVRAALHEAGLGENAMPRAGHGLRAPRRQRPGRHVRRQRGGCGDVFVREIGV